MVNSIEERGRLKGMRGLLRDLLEKKFGPLPPNVQPKIEEMSAERLKEVSLAILTAQSLKELGLTDE